MKVIGRPREFDRGAALEAAMLLFWRKGFATTSMNDLCSAMGIRSPSLYAAFGSKENLYLEAVEHYVRTVGPSIWDRLSAAATARLGMENLLLAATDSLPQSRATPAGCMAALAAVCDEWPPVIMDVVRNVRRTMLGHMHARLEAAVLEGELPPSTDVDCLSRFYFSVFEGMAVQARDGAGAVQLRGVAATAMTAWPTRNPCD